MATFDLDEQEQISELKLFWQQNGKFITAGIAGIVVSLAGWQGWNWHQSSRAHDANVAYHTLLDATAQKDGAKIKALAGQITTQFPASQQAMLAALITAKFSAEAKDTATARSFLQIVVDQSRDQGLRDIATLRLASLLLDEKNNDGALKLLSREATPAFTPRMLDLKGDVLAASGKTTEARAAWQDALVKIDVAQKGEIGSAKIHGALRDIVVAKLESTGPAK